jgi:hypothetical protein
VAGLVVDASVAVKWFIDEPETPLARRLFEQQYDLIAPSIIIVELANALRRGSTAGHIRADLVEQAVRDASGLFSRFISDRSLIVPALKIAMEIGHPIYDCLYLAAARAEACKLVTADAKFVAKLVGTPFEKDVKLLADWASSPA